VPQISLDVESIFEQLFKHLTKQASIAPLDATAAMDDITQRFKNLDHSVSAKAAVMELFGTGLFVLIGLLVAVYSHQDTPLSGTALSSTYRGIHSILTATVVPMRLSCGPVPHEHVCRTVKHGGTTIQLATTVLTGVRSNALWSASLHSIASHFELIEYV
jgi:hypothetical protein